MKHLLKTAVLLVIGLLAAQPVLSSLSCAAGMVPACAPGCPMAMSSMAPDCPMSGMSASGDCQQNCCTQNTINAVLPQTPRDKSKVTVHIPVAALASAFVAARFEKPAMGSLDRRVDSPPIYILNQTFRI